MYPPSPETKIRLHLHQQKSLKSTNAATTDSPSIGGESSRNMNVILYHFV